VPDSAAGAGAPAIETARLRLIPFAPAQLLALFEGVPQFEQRMGMRIADGLRDFFVSGEVSPDWLAGLRAATGDEDPWQFGFAIIDRASSSVVGSASLGGPPDAEGMVELSYGVAPGYQGRGYATEVAAALVAHAFGSGRGVRLVRAHTRPEPNASTRVLTKCGFRRIGEVVVPEDGLVWRWEREA